MLEAIIGLPILAIALFAIVEFGLLSSNQAFVHAASRAGADAAVGLGCDLPVSGGVPNEVVDAVEMVLAARGITVDSIRVEHTIGPSPPYVLTTGTNALPPTVTPPTDDYVCVSVGVENTELAPNMLSSFCVDLDETFSQQTVCRCVTCGDGGGDGGGGGGTPPVILDFGFIPGTASNDPLTNPGNSTIQLSSGGGPNIAVTIFDDGTWTSDDGAWEGTWSGSPSSGSVDIETAVEL